MDHFFYRTSALSGVAAIALVASPASAQAQARSFDIPAQPLGQAILEFSRQGDVVLTAPPALVRGKRSSAVRGSLRVEDAAARMIQGTGLKLTTLPGGGMQLTGAPGEPIASGDSGAVGDESTNDIIVTGTNLTGRQPVGSPLTTYDRADITNSGVATIDQFLRTIPQNFASIDPSGSLLTSYAGGGFGKAPSSAGGSAVNLHGIGEIATLTLLNGHRLAPAETTETLSISPEFP